MNFGPVLCVAFSAIWAVAISTGNTALADLLLINGAVQLVLFGLVAWLPFMKTGRMSFVDIAWPFGVALIGVQIALLGDGEPLRRFCVAGVYLLIGLRMGLGALTMARATGVIFQTEFPRYEYRRMLLEGGGKKHVRFHMQAEILAQGLANVSVLAIPGFLLSVNGEGTIHLLEGVGIGIWLLAYLLESTADVQKLRFIANNRGGVCNVGLWKYSRHPNYFSEWLVWTGIVIAAIPSWWSLLHAEALFTWIVLGAGGAAASLMMYITLVYLTGAVPAEYYSVRKRPDYQQYQQTTNRFFPWFPRK